MKIFMKLILVNLVIFSGFARGMQLEWGERYYKRRNKEFFNPKGQ